MMLFRTSAANCSGTVLLRQCLLRRSPTDVLASSKRVAEQRTRIHTSMNIAAAAANGAKMSTILPVRKRNKQCARWSSSALATNDDPAADTDTDAGEHAATATTTRVGHRQPQPRLQALRERLSREEASSQHQALRGAAQGGDDETTKTAAPFMLNHWTKSRSNSSSSSSSSSDHHPIFNNKDNDDNNDNILQRLDHTLPLLSTNRDSHTLGEQSGLLTDSFQRQHSYLRISLVERCNLRCRYCMPPQGVPLQASESLLTRAEILQLAKLFDKHGVRKVRLTGGEPMLRHDVVEIVHDLSTSLDNLQQLGMTTNGVALYKHLPQLVDAGLTHVNISLDSLQPSVFEDLTRRSGKHLSHVLQSVETACELLSLSSASGGGVGRVKLNVVVMKGVNDGELEDFCHLTTQYPFLDVRFIEWMPFSQNGWNQGRFVSYQDMLQSLQHLQLERVSDGPHDTTKWWKLPMSSSSAGASGAAAGRIGFITSMSEHFCGTCNRLRLTADGKLKVCLFGSKEVSLRDVLRAKDNDADYEPGTNISNRKEEVLERLIHYAVQRKKFALGGHGSAQGIAKANDNRPMTLIGG